MRKSLSKQLFVYFFILILFSMSMVGVFSYVKSSEAIDEQVEKYFTTVINSASMQTDNQLQTFERVTDSILSQQQVKKFLDMDPDDSYAYYEFTNGIRKDIFDKIHITYPTQINMIYILGYHGRSIFDANQGFSSHSVDTTERLEELNDKTERNGRISIMSTSLLPKDQGQVITVARKIRGYSSYSIKGVLAIEFREEQLTKLWKGMDLGENGFFFILDSQGEVVYAPDSNPMGELLRSDIPDRIVRGGEERLIAELGGQERMIVSRRSDYSGWSLAISMPLEELRAPISAIRTTTVGVGLLTLAIALFMAVRFGRSIVQPIRTLMNGMREMEKGNWQTVKVKPREDEVGGLVHSFNLMVGRLSEMIGRVYDAELKGHKAQLELQDIQLERQKAEFQALQLQINPHFLYNTLETINCYAIVQDSDDITEMVEAMAFMLRYSVQTNLEESTIVNELNHVRNYLIILKHRIGREFELEVAVEPSLLLEGMVRLTLQPIVENVFQHAFPGGIEPHHCIRVDARLEQGSLFITVEDNGEGMSEKRLAMVRQRLKENRLAEEDELAQRRRKGGIGILNVHRRIQMVYGNDYGIQIDSAQGSGTVVTMVMPRGQLNE
ncbi:MAG: integral rane sensor signal transduction histidine kinase [Paenibacillus sp.]|nr:integral rane sensor signal transduction histidine kinase [Paenibacillus sp.]